MSTDKKPLNEVIGRMVVTKEGKRLGVVKDITFETGTGELLQLLLKDQTSYSKNLNLEITQEIAIGDFVVVAEEDLL